MKYLKAMLIAFKTAIAAVILYLIATFRKDVEPVNPDDVKTDTEPTADQRTEAEKADDLIKKMESEK